jgi:hypothetical protein
VRCRWRLAYCLSSSWQRATCREQVDALDNGPLTLVEASA